MSKLMELRQKKADLIKEGRDILAKAEEEERDLNSEENSALDAIDEKIEKIQKKLEREEKQLEYERSLKKGPHPDVIPDKKEEERGRFEHFGEQAQAVVRAFMGGNVDPRLVRAASGASEGVPADGGFLVQKDFATELLRKVYELGAVSSRVRRIPISANSNGLKINAIKETSRANGSRWGGIRAYWTEEAGTLTASKPEFRQMELTLHKLTGLCYATDELLADSSALGAVLTEGFAQEINFKVEDAVINGTGAGQPLGILNGGGLVTVAKESSQVASTVVAENIIKMWSRLYSRSRPNAVWFINQDVEPQLPQLNIKVKNVAGSENVGGLLTPIYQFPSGPSSYGTLMGRPVIPIEYCATLGTVGDIILADMGEYLMIDKGSMESAVSMHVRFINDEMTFRFIYRVDGQPLWNSALTPYKGSNTIAPFVVLATRS